MKFVVRLRPHSDLAKALRKPLVRRKTLVHGAQGNLFYRDQWVDPNSLLGSSAPDTTAAPSAAAPASAAVSSAAPSVAPAASGKASSGKAPSLWDFLPDGNGSAPATSAPDVSTQSTPVSPFQRWVNAKLSPEELREKWMMDELDGITNEAQFKRLLQESARATNAPAPNAIANDKDTYHYEEQGGKKKRVRGQHDGDGDLGGLFASDTAERLHTYIQKLQEKLHDTTDNEDGSTENGSASDALRTALFEDLAGSEPNAGAGVEEAGDALPAGVGSAGEDRGHGGGDGGERGATARSGGDGAADVPAALDAVSSDLGASDLSASDSDLGAPTPSNADDLSTQAPAYQGRALKDDRSDNPDDVRLARVGGIGKGTLKEKLAHNLAALDLLQQLEAEGRTQLSGDEQATLARYVGWGAFGQAFQDKFKWASYDPEDLPAHIYNYWTKADIEHYAIYHAIKERLSEEDFAAAKHSILNAHYTDPVVIEGMWGALQQMGFQGGRVLEPAMGTGNFLGFQPLETLDNCARTGVELDQTTGRIAQLLYPNARVHVKGFQDAPLPDNYYDVAISNVPFGAYGVHDPQFDATGRNAYTKSIHNYFFAKALDKVRPGGIVAFVTSHYTMDARTQGHIRDYLSSQADFLGAVRLPSNAFKENAGTDVTTDIIFLQKKDPAFEALHPRDAQGRFIKKWGDTIKQGEGEEKYDINEYYVEHPEMVLGTAQVGRGLYGKNEYSVKSDGRDLGEALQAALGQLPRDILHPPGNEAELAELDHRRMGEDWMKPYSYQVVDGQVMLNRPSGLEKVEGEEMALARLTALCVLRDKTQSLITAQLDADASEAALADLREDLGLAYDAFVARYGALHQRANVRAFVSDPDAGLLLSLEGWDEKTKTATKADIFTTRTMRPAARAESAGTAAEALAISLNESGDLDWKRISALLAREPEDIRDELLRDGRIFRDPSLGDDKANGGYVTAEEYLSGNVRRKLELARVAAGSDASFSANVEALALVQPEPLGAGDIIVNLGAQWVPPAVVNGFLEHIIGRTHLQSGQNLVSFNEVTREWKVKPMGSSDSRRDNANNITVFGSEGAPFTRLLMHALTQTQPNIYKEDPDDPKKRVLDKERTLAARQKLQEVKDKWREYLDTNPAIANQLADIYNEKYNTTRLREYDGSHLTFPGLSPLADGGDVRPHIRDAVWRALQTGNALFDHCVGAGKTKLCCITAMEQRRLGLARKPMIVVPNNNLPQWEADFRKYYPGAKILTVWANDWSPANRRELTAKIATGDWDAVLITHSAFEKIPVSEEAYRKYYEEERTNLQEALAQEERENGNSRTQKQIETALANLDVKMAQKIERAKKAADNCLYFEELGVDSLLVDEADLYKNLYFVSRQRGVAGLAGTESGRAQDMFVKSQWMLQKNNNRGLIFATGTPISNSMAEMWTMRRYLDMPKLREEGLHTFDAWSASFGEIKTALEKTASGLYKLKSRFAAYINAPEMIKAYRRFADVKTRADLKDILPTPELKDGAPTNNIAPMSEAQSLYMHALQERAEAMEKGDVDPKDDNHLKLSSDARMMSLDMRLIDPTAPDESDSKLNQCVRNIERLYHEGAEHQATQLVFIDLGTPKEVTERDNDEEEEDASEAEESNDAEYSEASDSETPSRMNHSIYEDIKKKLVERGIPAHQVAFATDFKTDAQRKARDAKMNSGELRVLIGSTARMGAGLNVQKKLLALHHLDCPWRPRDVEQREGRILRQGNQFRDLGIPVQIHRYGTEGSFDEIMWSTISRKASFIAQARSGNLQTRTMEEIDPMKLTSAQMAAVVSGNPVILERANIDVEMETLASLRRSHLNAQQRLQGEVSTLPGRIKEGREYATRLEAAAAQWEKDKPTRADEFRMSIQGATHTRRETANQALLHTFKSTSAMARGEGLPIRIGTIGSFQVEVHPPSYDDFGKGLGTLAVCAPDGKTRLVARTNFDAPGLTQTIDNLLRSFGRIAAQEHYQADEDEKNLNTLQQQLGKGFPQQERMNELEARAREIDALLSKGDGTEAADTESADTAPTVSKALGTWLKNIPAMFRAPLRHATVRRL